MDDKIGLKRGTVILKNHHQEWAEEFESEKNFLKNLLGDVIIDIQHIGSTAVPELIAKPIIDMLMAVKSLKDISGFKSLLENTGYQFRENGSNDLKVLFVKGPEERRTHYLHITELGSSVWHDDLAFRDYLRTHPAAVSEYQKIKENLASLYTDRREEYTKGKNEFINSILDKANN